MDSPTTSNFDSPIYNELNQMIQNKNGKKISNLWKDFSLLPAVGIVDTDTLISLDDDPVDQNNINNTECMMTDLLKKKLDLKAENKEINIQNKKQSLNNTLIDLQIDGNTSESNDFSIKELEEPFGKHNKINNLQENISNNNLPVDDIKVDDKSSIINNLNELKSSDNIDHFEIKKKNNNLQPNIEKSMRNEFDIRNEEKLVDETRNERQNEYPNLFRPSQLITNNLNSKKMNPNDLNDLNRESLLNYYRPSDLNDLASNPPRASLFSRDSLQINMNNNNNYRSSEMTNILGPLDDHYRLSLNTQIRNQKDTPEILLLAKKGKLLEIQKVLNKLNLNKNILQKKYIVQVRDPFHGQNIFHFAIRGGQLNFLRQLLTLSNNENSNNSNTDLNEEENWDLKFHLLDCPDDRNNTPLHLAAAKSRRMTKLLLENGAEVDSYNLRNQTALGVHLLTTKRDDPVITELLLSFKANPNAIIEIDSKKTLLHVAIEKNYIQIASRLIKHGARLDIKDENHQMVFDKINNKTLRVLLSKINFPPVWIPDHEKSNCMLCNKNFINLLFHRIYSSKNYSNTKDNSDGSNNTSTHIKQKKKLKINLFNGKRRHHCRHCGRLCCSDCSYLAVESYKFPKNFNNRFKNNHNNNKKYHLSISANYKTKRVCRTCNYIFKERQKKEDNNNNNNKRKSSFFNRVMNIEWDELNNQSNRPTIN